MQTVTVVKVFSETKSNERNALGERITRWLEDNFDLKIVDKVVSQRKIVDKVVSQSSNEAYYCLTITLVEASSDD